MSQSDGFDRECGLLVVGFGGAGIAAAVTARRMGASVLLVEKQPRGRHTPSTKMSGGLVMAVSDHAAATEYLDRCACGMVPRDVSAAWAGRALSLVDWLHELAPGLDLRRVGGAAHDQFPGQEAVDVYQPGGSARRFDPNGKAGVFLFGHLSGAIVSNGIEMLWETPARSLIRSEDGRSVIGVATGNGLRIRAHEGVVLCCGGFLQNEEMKRDFLGADPVCYYGNPGNTGDGVLMAQEIGAALWHMNGMAGLAAGSFTLENGSPLAVMLSFDPPGYVVTDRYGKRFADESVQARLMDGFNRHLLHYDHARNLYPRIPGYWFFDENRRRAGRLTLATVGADALGLYRWSEDNHREIEQGWIACGDTIEEAASVAGVEDPQAARDTVENYNRLCREGLADPFGRPAGTMVPVDRAPFYCVRLYPGGSNTTGGPRRNRNAQILDVRGNPIPGLYAAGELGQASGRLGPADGANLSEAFCFGQIAAESALSSRADG